MVRFAMGRDADYQQVNFLVKPILTGRVRWLCLLDRSADTRISERVVLLVLINHITK